MKKLILGAMTAALAFASCTKEIDNYQTHYCEIYAKMEQENQTKTVPYLATTHTLTAKPEQLQSLTIHGNVRPESRKDSLASRPQSIRNIPQNL